MVRCPCERVIGTSDAVENFREIPSCRIENGGVVQSNRPLLRGGCVQTVPCVQSDMMVISTRRQESGLISVHHDQLESEQSLIKPERSLQI